MNETLQMITSLLGGLAVFIFGMNLMSDGLQKVAGDKMKSVIALFTRNPILGVLAGALCTAVLQSSSATTVMVIGFVSAGLMKLPQAISFILGANIGTTITAQLIAFKLGDYAWIFVAVGFIMYYFFKKKEKVSQGGQVLFAFGLLFVGINTMGIGMFTLSDFQAFGSVIDGIKDIPILGVVLGGVLTIIVQSSSAAIAMLQTLASTPAIDGISSVVGLKASLPILFGDNLGTTITALIASVGATLNAKRAALAHVVFNIVGILIFVWFIPAFAHLIEFISPNGTEVQVIARQIANAHLLYNVINVIIWIPFIWLMVKIVSKILPDKRSNKLPSEPIYIGAKIADRPVFAIYIATKELTRLSEMVHKMVTISKKAFIGNDMRAAKDVIKREDAVNKLQKSIVEYLASILASDATTESQAKSVSALLHVAADIEHIGDYCTNIAELSQEKNKNKYEFSDTASAEIYECFDQATRMLVETIKLLDDGDKSIAKDVLKQEVELNKTEERLRRNHMDRLHNNSCSPAFTVIYTDVVHNIEKIGDSCKNIAEAFIEEDNLKDVFVEKDKT